MGTIALSCVGRQRNTTFRTNRARGMLHPYGHALSVNAAVEINVLDYTVPYLVWTGFK